MHGNTVLRRGAACCSRFFLTKDNCPHSKKETRRERSWSYALHTAPKELFKKSPFENRKTSKSDLHRRSLLLLKDYEVMFDVQLLAKRALSRMTAEKQTLRAVTDKFFYHFEHALGACVVK